MMELLDDKVRVWLESAKFVKAKSGLYVFYNKKKEVIYIGESQNLQERFTKYIDTEFENNSCKQKTASYQREFVDNPKERKKQLLEDYKNRFGRLPACNDEKELLQILQN